MRKLSVTQHDGYRGENEWIGESHDLEAFAIVIPSCNVVEIFELVRVQVLYNDVS